MKYDQYIFGQWEVGESTAIDLVCNSTGKTHAQVKSASTSQIERAFQAARFSSPLWSSVGFESRCSTLSKYAEILDTHRTELAEIISNETGKPLWEAATEVGAMIGKIAISITAHQTRCADFGTAPSSTVFRPHGVISVLGPFNFPGHLPNGHIVPALLAGNTIVYKPSEHTPLTAIKMVQLLEESGIPAGVVNLVQGGAKEGMSLTAHPETNGIFFTGSSRTGHAIAKANADSGRILALEMGGNNPLVVSQVDNLTDTALLIIQSAFITAGQRCTCARRLILIENEQTDALLEKLITITRNIVIGPPESEPTPFMGAVIHSESAQAVIKRQQTLIKHGGKVLLKATILKSNTGLVSPAIIDVTGCDQTDEETFGPLLQVIRVANLADAIESANATKYGLAAGLLSNKKKEFKEFKKHINAGLINWNQQLTGASSTAPFGGIGHSGNHRPSAFLAADYCSYPVASIELEKIPSPETPPPGITL